LPVRGRSCNVDDMLPFHLIFNGFLVAGLSVTVTLGKSPSLGFPGNRPDPLDVHALVGGKVVTKPGMVLEKATILVRDGRIEVVGEKVKVPADARIWNLAGKTIYAGFVDAYLTLGETRGKALHLGHEAHLEATASLSFRGVPKVSDDPGKKGPGHEIDRVTPEKRVVKGHAPNDDDLKKFREIGFTAGNVAPSKGIFRGTSAVALLKEGDPNQMILVPDVAQCVSFDHSDHGDGYPHSLMGVISVIRQTFLDARHQMAAKEYFGRNPNETTRLDFNPALDALEPNLRNKRPMPVIFEPGSGLMTHRAGVIAREMKVTPIIVASGQEWRRPDLARAASANYIVPLNFPSVSKMPTEEDWDQVALDQLRAWDWAPENPILLSRGKTQVALTTHGLASLGNFRKNLRKTLDRGMSEEKALASLTTIPAKMCGISDLLGEIAPGKLANFVVVDGNYFDPKTKIQATWVEGKRYPNRSLPTEKKKEKKENDDKDDEKKKLGAELTARIPAESRKPLAAPPAVIFRGVTAWTCGPKGILKESDVLVVDGKITRVGIDLKAPQSMKARIVNGKGKHLTPGIIDCHSHSMILGRVNESTLPSSAMVRIADVVNSESENIFRQLAGGVTAANLLHGSANPIGGQNAVVKLRHGQSPEGMMFAEAPSGIKFALGENVKQSNWSEKHRTRFPQSRMGVKTFFAHRFSAANLYLSEKKQWETNKGFPVRTNLELEAIGEIIQGKRLIHCHSYRQDEILVLLRLMENFKVKIGTFQHVLEGYKVADEIAAHGAGGSAFADWWAYKFEVYDAIPYAGAIMHDRGVTVSFNSDSSDHARRLNLEAAKAVKYGGVSEEEALKFVTLNPAKQLGVDQWAGSIEKGKHADLVLWSGHPLHYASKCEQTWIDGILYYDRDKAPERAESLHEEREELLKKAKIAHGNGDEKDASQEAKDAFFRRAIEYASSLHVHSCRNHSHKH
jgi:imidazolonepropionase-like amidohydrolase